jgi:hypothetical protein
VLRMVGFRERITELARTPHSGTRHPRYHAYRLWDDIVAFVSIACCDANGAVAAQGICASSARRPADPLETKWVKRNRKLSPPARPCGQFMTSGSAQMLIAS